MIKCERCGHVNSPILGHDKSYRPLIDGIKSFYNFPFLKRWVLCSDIAKELGLERHNIRRIGKVLRYLNVPTRRLSAGVYFYIPYPRQPGDR